MNLAPIATQIAPFLVDQYVQSQVAAAEARGLAGDALAEVEHNAREFAITVSQVVTASLEKQEDPEAKSRSRFVAHIAADLLRGWPGEPTAAAAREAVAIAKTLVDEAERVCRPPARSASPPEA